ncbi:hypothetical protein A5821_002920 [Enterococcus sp. 7F3_DIV0205]|uniref:AbrB family transcriptional regulator n=1 Tax=Candidatus Enterococcus palustris TaxID=1834189 RepID=A0AAQ3WAL3_9ENTE|nr:AbrB family transcriptional regulator [Enterococcus sp. 7F3_DIV0205]OTN83354.1 hypothetical protein A5821_003277 [Enterococcus sp. 7F3_DIV0205]
MDTVKARRQGNAIMVTLSSKFAVKDGQEFFSYKDSEGIISLIPKVDDYFANAKPGEFTDSDDHLATDFTPKGIELDN